MASLRRIVLVFALFSCAAPVAPPASAPPASARAAASPPPGVADAASEPIDPAPSEPAAPSPAPATSSKAERRCGYLDNPTPANWWLTDRDGEWVIGVQGGHQADGIDRIPDFGRAWKVTNAGSHGYGCACLSVVTDAATRHITSIASVEVLPLSRCRADRHIDPKGR